MILTPRGNRGNYFSQQNRSASRFEWMESIVFQPIERRGRHNLRLGWALARSASRGEFTARPVNIVDEQSRLRKRLEFAGGQPFDRSDMEIDFYVQDHWGLNPKTALDLGLRVERQAITRTLRFAPRTGVAWTPLLNRGPVLRAGFGVFYDRVPLSIYSFESYPDQVITTYNPEGGIGDGPRRFLILSDSQRAKSFHSSAPGRTWAPLHLIAPPGVWVLNNLCVPLFGFKPTTCRIIPMNSSLLLPDLRLGKISCRQRVRDACDIVSWS